MRFTGVNIVASRQFIVFIGNAKRSFYRAANGIFGKIGRIASEEVILQLIKSKCISALLYGLVNRFCMKLFNTSDMNRL